MTRQHGSTLGALVLIAIFGAGCDHGETSAAGDVAALGVGIDRLEAEAERHASKVMTAPDLASVERFEHEHIGRMDAIMDSMMEMMGGLSSCTNEQGETPETQGLYEAMQRMRDECVRHMEAELEARDMGSAQAEEEMHQHAMDRMMDTMRDEQGSMQEQMGSYRCDHCVHCGS